MKIEFEKEYLRDLYDKGITSDEKYPFLPQIVNGYVKCVRVLAHAEWLGDLRPIKSLDYRKPEGDKNGLSSVRINDQYRLEFREKTKSENSTRTEICSLTDITSQYN